MTQEPPKGFKSAYKKAEAFAKDTQAVSKLVDEAFSKAEKHKSFAKNIRGDLLALMRMVKSWAKGAYKVSWSTIVAALAALLYFVNPLDVIPDFIIGAGFLDDASVLAFVMKQIQGDIKTYLEWEKAAKSAETIADS